MFDLSTPIFDAHLHVIDKRFHMIPNQGYLPDEFDAETYLKRMENYNVTGGAVVSGSFQGFDQEYLYHALQVMGPSFVGVTQLPVSVPDAEIVKLNDAGVRALRFNLKRGGSETVEHLERMARRVHDIAGWHVELYIDSKELPNLFSVLINLPAVSIDHLALSKEGFSTLLRLVEAGIKVKATGFGRVDFNVKNALESIYRANPDALMFGTDLPSTRAPRAFRDDDIHLVCEVLGHSGARKVLHGNAVEFYGTRSLD
jgi:predicted TIM-barrel fold metal-dependent hydrolase